MAEGNFSPTYCRIESATVENKAGDTYDITGIIGEFSFVQGINRISINGTLTCLDSVGILENFGLRGEEKLDLVVKAYDFGTTLRLQAQIYRIDGVERSDDGGSLMYKLYFLTRTSYLAELRKVTEAYRDKPASYIAEQLFKKNYSQIAKDSSTDEKLPGTFPAKRFNLTSDIDQRKFYVQQTDGNLQLIIPNFRPSRAMEFVAGKSYSTHSLSNSFRFFENFDGYHFVTDEFLIELGRENPNLVHELHYLPVNDKTPEVTDQQRKMIERLTASRRAHTGKDLYNGAYVNKVVEIDLLQHKVNYKTFNYLTDAKYFTGKGQAVLVDDVHTEDFIKDTFLESNAKQFMVFRDYSGPEHIEPDPDNRIVRGDQFYAEIMANRAAYGEHLVSNSIDIGMKGRLDIQAGHIVNLLIPEINASSTSKMNKQLAGNYLVTGVTHVVKNDILDTAISLVKYGNVGNIE